MIENLIDTLATAFQQVVDLVGNGLDGAFGAVANLSSNLFGGEDA